MGLLHKPGSDGGQHVRCSGGDGIIETEQDSRTSEDTSQLHKDQMIQPVYVAVNTSSPPSEGEGGGVSVFMGFNRTSVMGVLSCCCRPDGASTLRETLDLLGELQAN